MSFKRKELGSLGEEKAAEYLLEKGHKIVSRNFQIRSGEIDIISEDGEYLVFTEVKTRSRYYSSRPADSVDIKKIMKIRKTAEYFYSFKTSSDKQPRFDIIEIVEQNGYFKINHIENAF